MGVGRSGGDGADNFVSSVRHFRFFFFAIFTFRLSPPFVSFEFFYFPPKAGKYINRSYVTYLMLCYVTKKYLGSHRLSVGFFWT